MSLGFKIDKRLPDYQVMPKMVLDNWISNFFFSF